MHKPVKFDSKSISKELKNTLFELCIHENFENIVLNVIKNLNSKNAS